MAFGFFKFLKGINLKPNSTTQVSSAGDIDFATDTNKATLHNGTTSSPLVTEAHTATLTNKTLSGNTATNLISGSGTLTLNTSGTVTVPNGTDTLVGKATTDTLTNKTFDADGTGNSITNIENADIKAGAAIDRTKIASGTNYRILANNSSGVMSENAALTAAHNVYVDANGQLAGEATVAKSRGGTGADNSSVTFPSSGTVQATTPNNHGVLVSGTGATATVIAPNASTAYPLVSGGASADPSWAKLSEAGGGTNQSTYTTGDMLYASATNTLSKLAIGSSGQVIKQVGGVPTWATFSGGINYLSANPDAEADTSGWSTYADAAGTSPVDGTGGSPNITWTRSTSSPLRGSASFLETKGAANRQGEGVSYAFTIDSADQAKVLQVTADYAIASGTYADGDLTVYIYDVTNAVVIQPAGYSINNLAVGLPGKINATFQTASNSTSYRLCIHTASTSTSAYTVKFDNFYVGPQIVEYGAPVTDWVAYTPTISAAFGTTSGVAFYYRRVGDLVEISGTFVAGTAAASIASLSLPSGLSVDTAKLSISGNTTSNTGSSVGHYTGQGGVSQVGDLITAPGTSTTLIYFGKGDATTLQLTPANGNVVYSGTPTFAVSCKVPIAGWSSSVVMSNDTDTRVVAARMTLTSSNYSVTQSNWTVVKFNTINFDTHNGYSSSTGLYTCPVSGYYRVNTVLLANTSGGSCYIGIWKNGAGEITSDGSSGVLTNWAQGVVKCNAGDTLGIYVYCTTSSPAIQVGSNSNESTLSIDRLSGPSAIAASETVAASYTRGAAQSIPNATTTTFIFDTKDYDTHNSYNTSTGIYTIPISGKYRISTAIIYTSTAWIATSYCNLSAVRAGSASVGRVVARSDELVTTGTFYRSLHGSVTMQFLAGDTFTITTIHNQGTSVSTVASDNNEVFFTIERIGN